MFYNSLLLACEFCSSFTRVRARVEIDTNDGFKLERCRPLLSQASFKEIEGSAKNIRATRLVKRIAHSVIENAYSPAEIALALRLTLAEKDGGFGLPRPILNSCLPLKKAGKATLVKELFPDLLWPEQRVIFEYDGSQYHSQEEHIQRDSGKRNVLINEGYEVFNVTKDQLFNEQKLMLLAECLRKRCYARKTSIARKNLSPSKLMAREALRRVVIDYVVKGKFY
ncbi:MAG: hypothetical protein HUJ51_06100 [Eggerthellaceae bacterium]|nr:hypothetical protein [Eggerthellaceae bacterium]